MKNLLLSVCFVLLFILDLFVGQLMVSSDVGKNLQKGGWLKSYKIGFRSRGVAPSRWRPTGVWEQQGFYVFCNNSILRPF